MNDVSVFFFFLFLFFFFFGFWKSRLGLSLSLHATVTALSKVNLASRGARIILLKLELRWNSSFARFCFSMFDSYGLAGGWC
ncbi:hypothetical protein EUGRSUZ_H02079 [Eucalyptus grandis]|uniref:Uncharacterized protein n=2 Tax=Eucalyptus grandis TaxID=71139 RepID=A0A059B0G7_EUCGR|nr:hypothetical protein EUGRSUZ_H02079 [Eucalyptus grandis]